MNLTPVLEDACVGATFCIIVWVVFSTITRHLTARSYNSMQEKVFESGARNPSPREATQWFPALKRETRGL